MMQIFLFREDVNIFIELRELKITFLFPTTTFPQRRVTDLQTLELVHHRVLR